MGILKKLSKAAEKADRGYQKAKKDSAGIRKAGGKILDWALPPPKKKKPFGKSSRTKTVKMGGCTCKCPK